MYFFQRSSTFRVFWWQLNIFDFFFPFISNFIFFLPASRVVRFLSLRNTYVLQKMRLKNNWLQVLGVAGEAERAWNKAWILILEKAKEVLQLLLSQREVKSMQQPWCISQGVQGRPKSSGQHAPGSVPCHAGQAAALPWLVPWLQAPGCVAGWTLAKSHGPGVPFPWHRGPNGHLGSPHAPQGRLCTGIWAETAAAGAAGD